MLFAVLVNVIKECAQTQRLVYSIDFALVI